MQEIDLEQFTKEDFATLIKWTVTEETLVQFAGTIFSYPLTNEQLIAYLAEADRYIFKVVSSPNRETIGHAEINITVDKVARLCRIIIGNESNRGKGIGQLILTELLNISFNQLHAISASLNVYNWNVAAIRCYEKVGFSINKGITSTTLVNGKSWTALNMVLNKELFLIKKV